MVADNTGRRRRRSADRVEKGIRRHSGGLQAYVRIRGELHQEFFAASELQEARDWIGQTKRNHFAGDAKLKRGTFIADIVEYVARRAAMPTIGKVERVLLEWADELGRDRPRNGVKSAELDIIMQRWLMPPPPDPDGTPPRRHGKQLVAGQLDTDTLRNKRYVLHKFYVVMNGKGGYNPVDGAFSVKEKPPAPRGTDYATIARIVDGMPDYFSAAAGTAPDALQRSLSKLRARVIAVTGIPPGTLSQLRPAVLHLDAAPPHVVLPTRKKGRGVESRELPLSAAGAAAFRDLADAGGLVAFNVSSLNRAFVRAVKRADKRLRLTIYDLRHSFAAEVYRLTGDEATVARLLMHAPGSKMTRRYTRKAHAAVDAAAVALFHAAVSAAAPALSGALTAGLPDAAAAPAPAVRGGRRGRVADRSCSKSDKRRRHSTLRKTA